MTLDASCLCRGLEISYHLYCPVQVYGELSNSQESIQSRSGVLFFLSVNQMMLSIMSIIMTFPLERAAFVRENRAGM